MAKDLTERIIDFWAELPRADEDFLGSIRDWKNIQIAVEDDTIWLKGFTEEQAVSPEVQQLPDFILYELRNGLLFKKSALVPAKKIRTALLWSPIDKALRLVFPPSNQNFFGIKEKIKIQLKPSTEEQPAVALLSLISQINDMVIALPKFKLERNEWIVIEDKALFLGIPLLSLPGKTYWEKDGHLLPTGFDFEFKNLSPLLQRKYNEHLDQWLLWNEDGSYLSIVKKDLKKLSASSYRLTQKAKEWN
ncbi:hypothetical protein CEY12_18325 [Chryseobacterium sp. T16E-39]|uniref:hypothetical protein n=1 Tax=Chryseobacterium sp. T16E-39 TaxID=2015076 RepID=UPI000B5B11B3|nr:hypothetical protein [Chryseobacterium sp. T16E-39]ASK31945.1 hypothetical protein CEY12_18325 [Chryseobacterium sp. T16E-39]